MLCLIVPFDRFPVVGTMVGAPIPSATEVMNVGEIPVDVVMLPETSIVSSGDGKEDFGRNSRRTDGVYAAHADAETDIDTQNRPTASLGNGTIHGIAYSPDGKLIAAAGAPWHRVV